MRSKQELLYTIVNSATAEVLSDFDHSVAGSLGPAEKLYRATKVFALRHATHRRQAIIVNRDTTSLDEPYLTQIQNRRRQHEHAMRLIISDGVRTGFFSVASPTLASFAIREMCVSISRWFRDGGELTADEVGEQYACFSLRIVGYSGPPPSGDIARQPAAVA
jgi:hypothetical protein